MILQWSVSDPNLPFKKKKEAIVELWNHNRSFNAELFKSMKNLRLLHVNEGFTSGEPTYFPEQLRWLNWSNYPFDALRITRDMTKLVGLSSTFNEMRQLQIEKKVIFPNLKFIKLTYSVSITMFPSVSGVPNLEWLDLSYCDSLMEVHKSVFVHEKIIYLNLSHCERLWNLPTYIRMKSLQTLLLDDCNCLESFPEVSMGMERLSVLDIQHSRSIWALPSSVRLLTGLTTLLMGGCFGQVNKSVLLNLLIQGSLNFSSLRVLDLSYNLLDDSFPINLHTAWPSLEEFDLSGNQFTRLPTTICQHSHLKLLDLSNCENLKEVPELPPCIQFLSVCHCIFLKKIGDLSNKYKWLFKILIRGCFKLNKESQSHIANMLMKSLVQKCAAVNHRLSITVPGSKIPTWFSNKRLGNEIELHLPHNQISKMIGLALCCRLSSRYTNAITIRFKPSYEEIQHIDSIDSAHPAKFVEDHIWVGYLAIDVIGNLCHGFENENLVVSFEHQHDVVECGVCVVYKDDIEPTTRTESWISDYDELARNDYRVEELQHGRRSSPAFSFVHWNASDQNSVTVHV